MQSSTYRTPDNELPTRRDKTIATLFRTLSLLRILLAALLLPGAALAEGRSVWQKVHSQELENNLLGDSPDRSVYVYLPPSYDSSPEKHYPVVYLLHGYIMNAGDWIGGSLSDLFGILPEVNHFMAAHPDRELIIVMPDGFNKYRGSWYANSPVTGNYEDFLTQELVQYIDSTYRTLPQATYRGLAGYSMGGAGAWRLAMRYPEVYGAMYALSGGGPLDGTDWIRNSDSWRGTLALENMIQFNRADISHRARIAAAAAYSPNPNNPPFFVDLPFELVGEEVRRVDAVWEKWVASFDVVAMAHTHREHLRQLRGIRFGFGAAEDPSAEGRPVSQALTELDIPHIFEIYKGGHTDDIPGRIETRVLPFMSRVLYGDLPKVQSTTLNPGTIVAGQSMPEITLVLAAPPEATGAFPALSLDLSSLGFSEALPMQHDGSGRYTARPSLTPLRTSPYSLFVSLEEGTPTPFPLSQLTLTVWPTGDLQVMEEALAEGWTLEGQSKVTLDTQASAQVYQGRSALAAQTSGTWRIVLSPAQPLNSLGYTALRFAFHPGDASGDLLDVAIGSKKVNLWPGQPGGAKDDLATKTWQVVEIPLDALGLAPDSPIALIRFSGKLNGTFYVDDLRLVASPPPPSPPTAVEEERTAALPQSFSLSQNFPNPFNSSTVIRFALPAQEEVELAVFNLAGQKVATLAEGHREAGAYAINWDGRDERGKELASGLYLYRLQAGVWGEARKLLLLR